MSDTPITAEDLTLYAMHLLDGMTAARVELLLRSSTEAREELARIRGDLAAFALAAPQHTPPALTRQRLLRQVAREGRAVPIPVAMQDSSPFRMDAREDSGVGAPVMRMDKMTAEERRSRVRLPRVMSEPELIFDMPSARDMTDGRTGDGAGAAPFAPNLPVSASTAQPAMRQKAIAAETVLRRDTMAAEAAQSDSMDPRPSRRPEAPVLAASISSKLGGADRYEPEDRHEAEDRFEPEDRYEPSTPFARSAYVMAADSKPARFGSLFGWSGWAAATALAAACAFLVYTNLSLNDRIDKQIATLTRNGAQIQRADVLLQTLQSPAAQRFVLARQDTAPVPAARVAYLPEHGSLVFQAANLEPLAAFKTYELWLIPAGEGRQPMAAGTFKPDSSGYATLVLPSLPRGTVAGNFGVTVEDDGGSTAPTLPILLIGQQG